MLSGIPNYTTLGVVVFAGVVKGERRSEGRGRKWDDVGYALVVSFVIVTLVFLFVSVCMCVYGMCCSLCSRFPPSLTSSPSHQITPRETPRSTVQLSLRLTGPCPILPYLQTCEEGILECVSLRALPLGDIAIPKVLYLPYLEHQHLTPKGPYTSSPSHIRLPTLTVSNLPWVYTGE